MAWLWYVFVRRFYLSGGSLRDFLKNITENVICTTHAEFILLKRSPSTYVAFDFFATGNTAIGIF